MDNAPILQSFEQILIKHKIPSKNQLWYKKWLSFYLQFCQKYSFDIVDKNSVDPFLKGMKSHGFKEFQVSQAQHALFLYHLQIDYSGITSRKPVFNVPIKFTQSSITSWQSVIDRLLVEIKLRHYSPHTFEGYSNHIRKFAKFCDFANPMELHALQAKEFLAHMATTWNCSASSQNVAFNALGFLFKYILKKPYEGLTDTPRAKRKRPVPDILSREEIDRLLKSLIPPYPLIAQLTYGCGLRLGEVMELRVHNFHLDDNTLIVYFGKGEKSRYIPLPNVIRSEIEKQLFYIKNLQKKRSGTGI